MVDEPTYTLAEIAAALGKDPSTIRYWVRQGHLAAEKVGRRWLVRPTELSRLHDQLSHQGAKLGDLQTGDELAVAAVPAARIAGENPSLNLADRLSALL